MSIRTSDLLKILAKTAGTVVISNGASQILFFVVMAILARGLGLQLFGLYSFGLAFAIFAGTLATLGMDSIVVREMTKQPERLRTLWSAAFVLRILSTALFFLLALVTVNLVGYSAPVRTVVYWFGIYIFVFSFNQFAENFYRVRLQMRIPSAAKVIARLLLLVVVGTIFRIRSELPLACVATTVCELIPLSWVLMLSFRELAPNFQVHLSTWLFFLRQSWPLALMSCSVMIYMRVDTFLLTAMAPIRAVGEYTAAVRISELPGGLGMAMQVALLPLLSKAAATTAREEFQSNYRKMAEYLLVVLVPLSLLLTVYAGSVIHAAYGSAYGRASVALQVLVWSGLFTTSGIFYSTALIAEGRQGVAACIAGIMALVNVVLNLWLIPDFQIVGAAVSSVVAYGLGPVLLLCYRQTRLYVQLFARALLLPGLSVVPMAILCLLLRKHVVFGLIFGVMAYCSTLALLVHQKYRSGRNQEIAKISILPAKYIGRLL